MSLESSTLGAQSAAKTNKHPIRKSLDYFDPTLTRSIARNFCFAILHFTNRRKVLSSLSKKRQATTVWSVFSVARVIDFVWLSSFSLFLNRLHKMSWLFGKKKHKDSPPDSRDEQENQPPLDPGDDFVVIEKRRTSLPPNVGGQDAPYPSGLYPFIGGTPMNPAMSVGNLPKLSQQQVDTSHYLSGVPFKLCRQLESNVNTDLEMDGLRISEILSFIERLENQNYDYDFSLEEGVIREMDSTSNE